VGASHRTRTSAIIAVVREMIMNGELEPGERLRQTDLAGRFRTSTTPVREALAALAREGLVRQYSHRGVMVFKPSAAELVEIYEIRTELEPLAAQLAAARIGEHEIAVLRDILAEAHLAAPARHHQLNLRFHTIIYGAAGRPRLLDTIESLRQIAAGYLALTVRMYDPDYARRVEEEHAEILARLEAGDGKGAGKATRRHLRNNERQVAKLLASESD
jgi:DNA-binding GntR family transcriptional regulator